MASSHLPAMHVPTRPIDAARSGDVEPFHPPFHLSATADIGRLVRRWERQALRGPAPRYLGSFTSFTAPRLDSRRINWSAVFALTLNMGIWVLMLVALFIISQ